jgi:hypothetical protein
VFTSRHLRCPLFYLCLALCWLAAGCTTSNNSKGTSTSGGGTPTGLQFISPATSPYVEPGQPVQVSVSESVTFSLQPSSGFGSCSSVTNNCGSLTATSGDVTTYTAPGTVNPNPPPCPGSELSTPQTPLLFTVVATTASNPPASATLTVIVVQSEPCIASIPTLTAGGQTYPSATNPPCPPAGSVIPYIANNGSGVDPFQVGVFNRYQVNDGGGAALTPTPFGVPPFTWSLTGGSLPDGLALSPGSESSSIVISGVPVSAGCSAFTMQITDADGISSSATLSLVVVPPSLGVQVPVLPSVLVNTPGIPYAPTTLLVSGGVPPYSWAYNPNPLGNLINGVGSLPPGLCINTVNSSIPSSGCTLSSPPKSSNIGVLWGTAQPNDVAPPAPNAYTAPLQINDSQQPYPAVALPYVGLTADFPQALCSPSNQSIPPSTLNGGGLTDNSIPADAYLSGSIAFLLRGFDANGPVVIAGSVQADGAGNITSGEEDISRSGGSQNVTIVPTGSSYAIGGLVNGSTSPTGSFNRGCMTLLNSAGTTTTFAFSLGGCSNQYTENGITTTNDSACGMTVNGQQQNVPAGTYTTGRIIEFDDSNGQGTRASGILRAQDVSSFSSGPSGPYAFGLSGWDATRGHYAMAGSMKASSGALSSVAADVDNAGTLSSQLTGGSGTYSSPDANGRASGTLTVGQASYDLALYLIGGSETLLLTTNALSASHPILGGEAITTSTSFANSSLQNDQIFHIGGVASTGSDVSVGVLSFDGIGTVGGTAYEDQAGTLGTTAVSGAYAVDSGTGRTAFTTPQLGQTLGAHILVAYVIPTPANLTRLNCSTPASCVTGFLVGTDSTAQDGVLEFQTPSIGPPPPFNNQYLEGDYIYGTDEALAANVTNFEGNVYMQASTASLTSGTLGPISGSPNTVGFVQDTSFGSTTYCLQSDCQLLFPDEPFKGSYSISTSGVGTFGGETVSVTNGNVIFYIGESPLSLQSSVVVVEQ